MKVSRKSNAPWPNPTNHSLIAALAAVVILFFYREESKPAAAKLPNTSWTGNRESPPGCRRIFILSERGRQTAALDGPQRTTPGRPKAAARWVTPESWPTKPAQEV